MSETDPAASSESGSDLLAELARQKERIARLESLLAEADRRVKTPKTDQGEAARPKITGNGGQTPVRLSELGPQLQGFAEAVMAYTAPMTGDLPPKTQDALEPMTHPTHERRQPASSSRPVKPRGLGRGGLMALLLSGALLTVVFAGAGVLYNRFLASDLDNVPAPASKHYRPVPRDPVEPPEVLPVEESTHALANRPPGIEILPEKLQGSSNPGPSPVPAALPPAQQKTQQQAIRPHRRHHRRHKAAAPAAPKPELPKDQPTPVEARRSAPHPAHYRIVEAAPRPPAPKPVHKVAQRTNRPASSPARRRLQLALAGTSMEHKHAALSPPAPKQPPIHAFRHPRRRAGSLIPPHAHPGYDEKADAWMDRLP